MHTETFYQAFKDAFAAINPAGTALPIPESIRVVGGVEAQWARISVETQACRYRVDGGVPTASAGHPLATGTTIDIYGDENIRRFRIISQSTAADVMITTGAY